MYDIPMLELQKKPSVSDFKTFLNRYPVETYEKGQTILLKDEFPRGVYIIEFGQVKTYLITTNGSERLISIDGRNEDFPIGYAFGIIDKSEYFYEAYSRCRLRIVPREDYLRHLNQNIESLTQRHIRMTILLLTTLRRVNALEHSQAGDKVAYTLLYMADQLGYMLKPKSINAKLHVTQQEIANLLGLSRETTGIELKKLEVKKLISHSRKNYVLYTERLLDYLKRR